MTGKKKWRNMDGAWWAYNFLQGQIGQERLRYKTVTGCNSLWNKATGFESG